MVELSRKNDQLKRSVECEQNVKTELENAMKSLEIYSKYMNVGLLGVKDKVRITIKRRNFIFSMVLALIHQINDFILIICFILVLFIII